MRIQNKGPAKIDGVGVNPAAGKRLPARPLSAQNMMKLTKGLAVGFPDRVFGTATGKKSAEWMADQLKSIGVEPWDGDSYLQEFEWDIGGVPTPGFNVGGIMRGTDPKLADEFIVISAHHDSQPDTRVGANDNASGCAGVLAIAQAMAKNPPKRSVLFMTFDGEEGMKVNNKYHWGRRGSKHFAKTPMVPLAKTALLLNMDMIGQVHLESGSRKDIHQWASRDSFAQQMLSNASKATLKPGENAVNGYPEQHDQAQMFSTDAEPLYRLGIPTVNFLSGRDLDNHAPEDDMTRIIPERIEQYAVLAHEVAVQAANHPESLQQMGITPGGLMPSYSMIRAAKGAGSRVLQEEQMRLDDLVTRMPTFKETAAKLVAQIGDSAEIAKASGIDLKALAKTHGGMAKEAVLSAVRTVHAELAGAIRDLNKNDVAARKPLQAQMKAVQGIEDVLSGAIYIAKTEKNQNYYTQQVPARLADINRGAKRLGLKAELKGVVFDKDVVAFAPTVSADRAMHMAMETLSNLGKEVGIAAYALLSPLKAATDERPINAEDTVGLRANIEAAARAAVQGDEVGGDALPAMAMQAALTAQLGGIKGTPKKWAANFGAKNVFTDFDQLIRQLALPKAKSTALVAKAATMQASATAATIVDFYSDLTGHIMGQEGKISDLSDLRTLSNPEVLAKRLTSAGERAKADNRAKLVDAAGDDDAVARLTALAGFTSAAIKLSGMFDPKEGTLAPGTRLAEVKGQIDAVADAASKLAGADSVATELTDWSQWLSPFLGLEGRAKEQSRVRSQAAKSAQAPMTKAWTKFAAALQERQPGLAKMVRGSGAKTFAAFEELHKANEAAGKKSNAAFEQAMGQAALFKTVEHSLVDLVQQPSAKAEADLKASLQDLDIHAGATATAAVKKTLDQLDRLHELDDVQMGRQSRGGPLSMMAVRAALEG